MPAFPHRPGPAGQLLDRLWQRVGRPAAAAIAASAAGLVFIEFIVLVVWGADTGSSTGPAAALRVGADLWLVAHGTTLRLPDGVISFRPLGLALFPLAAALSAAHRRAAAAPAPSGSALLRPGRGGEGRGREGGEGRGREGRAGRSRPGWSPSSWGPPGWGRPGWGRPGGPGSPWDGTDRTPDAAGGGAAGAGSDPTGRQAPATGRAFGAGGTGGSGEAVGADNRGRRGALIGVPWGAVMADIVGVVGAQTLFVVLVALVVRSGPARPTLLSAALGTIALGLPAALLGTLAGRHRLRTAWRTLPGMLRSSLLCGAGAFASLIAIAAFGVALVLAATLPEVAGAERALDVGVLGGIGLAATQLALVPNLVLWGLAYALGPGFRTGPGLVRVDAVHPAELPDLPVLAALPPNALPRPGWVVLALVPIVAGIVLVAMVHRSTAGSRSRYRLATVLLAGVTCGLLTGLAIQASIGRVGGVDGHYGPTAGWVCGLLAGGEVAAVGLLLLGGIDLAARRAERPFLAEDAEPSFWRRRMSLPGSGLSARPSRRTQ
ncbi:hypothetical protein FF36_01543 [Frankia torreyi]|uniref:Uncharacterized protein n=1 Tax=Frankia torreyi TaxID=1856 RepID=A0A0D8BJ82_9ACTN|nr:DUF6350 family protein [Frankia torreyi]KJE24140.1 hypothetical protein FF36_01543 [Frankia torreyi]